MKKKLVCLLALAAVMLVMTGCCFHSEWYAANCTTPKTCVECGETEGEALGHTWVDATCTAAKTCTSCNLTEGEALGHDWQDATTEAPQTCAVCAATEGERIITDERFTTAATAEIQGTWAAELTLPGEMMGMEGLQEEIKLEIVLDLGNDGTMGMSYSMINADTFMEAMKTYMIDTMFAEMEAAGYGKEKANEIMVDEIGMTVEEYAEAIVAETDLNAIFEAMNITGVYYVEGGKLYTGISWTMELEPSDFTVDGDTLTMGEDLSGLSEDALVFNRVN